MAVNNDWITLLFKRFDEIYLIEANAIDKTLESWVFALQGINAEQIKHALEICRSNITILPTPILFRELCLGKKSLSNDNNSNSSTKEAIITRPESTRIIPLQWPDKSLESSNSVSDIRQKKDWQQELLAMDESSALINLSPEHRYDRTRLLMEKQGREQVSRMQALASDKPQIKRRDWE